MEVWMIESPDLTPLDIYTLGYLKMKVYVNELQNPNDLHQTRQEIRLIVEYAVYVIWEQFKKHLLHKLLLRHIFLGLHLNQVWATIMKKSFYAIFLRNRRFKQIPKNFQNLKRNFNVKIVIS